MTSILKIDASARVVRSLTRDMTSLFVSEWYARESSVEVRCRDVGVNPPNPVSEDWISAAFATEDRTPAQSAALRESDELIDEIEWADVIVLGSPMYNYGVPAQLKAWIDQIVRIGRTFSFDLDRGDTPIEPILSGKTLVLLSSSGEGGLAMGEANAAKNHLQPHLMTIAPYLGAQHVQAIGIEYQEFKDQRHEKSIHDAHEDIRHLVEHLHINRSLAPPSTTPRMSGAQISMVGAGGG